MHTAIHGLVYSCGPGSTGTGPNAVSLLHFNGASLPFGAGVLILVSSLAVSVLVWLRRR